MCPERGESIYLWMYRQGLAHRDFASVVSEARAKGHAIREKDTQNYWNGHRKRDMLNGMPLPEAISQAVPPSLMPWESYPTHPYVGTDVPEVAARYVPCRMDGGVPRPLIKWGRGCMTLADAKAWPGCDTMAENLCGTQLMVIDVDGDHGGSVHRECLEFFSKWMDRTCCHMKRRQVVDMVDEEEAWDMPLELLVMPTSYHLTFSTARVVPTMHFPKAHVDVVGNARNSLRYFKDKAYNGLAPAPMGPETWAEMTGWLREMGER